MSESEYDSSDSPSTFGTLEEGDTAALEGDTSAQVSSSASEDGESEAGESGKDMHKEGESGREDASSEETTSESEGESLQAGEVAEGLEGEETLEEREDIQATKGLSSGNKLSGEGGDGDGESGEEEEGEGTIRMSAGVRKFLEDSDEEEAVAAGEREEERKADDVQEEDSNISLSHEVFGDSEDEEVESVGRKRKRDSPASGAEDSEEQLSATSRKKVKDDASLEEEGGEGESENLKDLREEVTELGMEEEGEERGVKGEMEGGGEGDVETEGLTDIGREREVGGAEERDSDEEPGPSSAGLSDWDQMMQRRKEAMARARRRRRRDIDITATDDHIMAMIRQMRQAAEEDRQLNVAKQPALKKLKMLPTVITQLKKSDLQTSFIECGILTILAEWLGLLPDNSLPHVKIRESILTILQTYPIPDSHTLKSSRIGKAVMLLYRHPKETRKNKERAGKIINEWARPIFGLASDFKSLGRDEREERDYANLSQAARRRLSSGGESKKATQEDDYEPQKPGDRGWVGRARVPMPSTKDYVVRPKWKVDHDYKKAPAKPVLNRFEKQLQKEKRRKMVGKSSHAVSISVEGRKMPL